ncbi:MAG: GNAT family N-acetyltransferase [Erysipelotrichaceae bacterium]|nr:GNAT family N-acetyltransferase [Erysipelotrichaceae bacterium]
MKIRKIIPHDREKLFAMMREFYDSPALLETVPDEILHRDIDDCLGELPFVEGFVFEKEGEIIGYGMIAKSYSTEFGCVCIWVEDLYLLPLYRGQGLGGKFFGFVEDLYQNQPVRFRLEVEPNNLNAIKAYRKNGYRQLGYVQMAKEKK